MKKKIWSLLLSAAMVCSMTNGISATPVASASVSKKDVKKVIDTKLNNSYKKNYSNNFTNNKSDKDEKNYIEGDVILTYKKNSNINSLKKAGKYSKEVNKDIKVVDSYDFTDNTLDKKTLKKASKNLASGLYIQKIHSDKLSTKELIKEYSKDENVLYAEPNYKISASGITDDTYSDFQWAVDNKKQNNGKEGADVNPQAIWNTSKPSTGEAVIAIVDSGVDYKHEDLKDVIWDNPYKSTQLSGKHGYDFFNMDDDPMDDCGHGSHCAGIIAAKANNKAGIAGIAGIAQKNVKIMALKFLSESGMGDTYGAIGSYYYVLKAKELGTNVVAVNNSWGGNNESSGFKEVLSLADAEGIVSVIAAGNDGVNADKEAVYPANDYSDNNIVVGASTENDDVADFSNYGAETVDIAAPGTDILSSVCYDCLNPTIYTDDQKKKLLSSYCDGENFMTDAMNSITVKVQDLSGVDLDDMEKVKSADDDPKAKDVTDKIKKVSSDTYFGKSGKSLMFDFAGAKKGERYTITIPYKTGLSKTDIYGSFMLSMGGPEGYNEPVVNKGNNKIVYNNGITLTSSVERYNAAQKTSYYDEEEFMGIASLSSNDKSWQHVQQVLIPSYDAKSDAIGGKITFQVDINTDNKCCFYLDDIAISKENADTSEFGKYDFYSGTSMAAPAVTGAIAELYENGDSAQDICSKLYSCVRKNDSWGNKCKTGGILDFSKIGSYQPVIRKTDVTDDSKINLIGYNFGKDKGSISINGTKLDDSKIISWSDTYILIDAPQYIYKTVEISLTNSKNNSVSSTYCIKDTVQKLSKVCDVTGSMEMDTTSITTDGTNIYMLQSGCIGTYDINTGLFNMLAAVTPDLLKEQLDGYEKNVCTMQFVSPLFYGADALWTVISIDGSYHDMAAIVKFDIKTNLISIIKAPDDLENSITGSTPAFYNNKIYFIGGSDDVDYDLYDIEIKLSDSNTCYDIKTDKWSKAASVPVKSSSGTIAVNNDKLYYLPGLVEDNKDSKLYCFDGYSWSVASEEIKFISDNMFASPNAIGICKDKLLFITDGSEGYGTVMSYDLINNKLEATGYDTGLGNGSTVLNSITIGDTCYFLAVDTGNIDVLPDDSTNAYKLYSMPVKGVSKPVVKVNKITVKATNSAKEVRYGKKLTFKATVSPKNATNKAVKWSVSNSKYASISSKGVLTPKKAGIGKTITVKATAKDGSKVSGSVKIKILKAKK